VIDQRSDHAHCAGRACPVRHVQDHTLLNIIRILILIPIAIFAIIGIALMLILWDIKHHPLSIFHWLKLLRQLPG